MNKNPSTIFSCQLNIDQLGVEINESKSFEEILESINQESELARCEHRVKLVELYLKRRNIRYKKTVTYTYYDKIDSTACKINRSIEVNFANPAFI